MGITLEASEATSTIRFEDTVDISSAAELKTLLLQALDSGKEVRISLEVATYLDVTAIELLWAAEREATKRGVGFTLAEPVPEGISAALLDAGFDKFPVAECAG
jgi:anti-anti-sigma regulatory factor